MRDRTPHACACGVMKPMSRLASEFDRRHLLGWLWSVPLSSVAESQLCSSATGKLDSHLTDPHRTAIERLSPRGLIPSGPISSQVDGEVFENLDVEATN